ncbi:MAG: hypothetical protein EH225_11810 [Calditrichaeota bacterium]|nr:MAG: hypothetical protein EH225_11810 [Calditrichota bacterium]
MTKTLPFRKIFIFWIPLAATWLMMSVEGPFLAAIIARLPDPKYNLAAYGVAFAFALIIEAPVIMIMSASTALVRNRESFFKLRNFTYVLNGGVTVLMLLLLIPRIFYFITENLMGLDSEISRLTHTSLFLLLPWPGAIGYRRFYQGILIRCNFTKRVAYGTVIRLISMAGTALLIYRYTGLDGALVGAIALSTAVTLEAIASRMMAYRSVQIIKENACTDESSDEPLTYPGITRFYYPLALTSLLALGVQPLVTFFLGNSRMALDSLAVLPVVSSLVFIFRGLGLSFQEVGIVLMGKKNEHYRELRNFASLLGVAVVTVLSLIAFTPLAGIWYADISGLSVELSQFALTPTQIMVLMPGLTVLLAFQRSLLVTNKKTTPITVATSIEVLTIVSVLFIMTRIFDFVGIIAAACALLGGRLLANSYLFLPFRRVLSRLQ